MSLPQEIARTASHVTTMGATRDQAMAAELLRPMFGGGNALALLLAGQKSLERALHFQGLTLGPAVMEPVLLYSLSMMDRQIRFEVVRPEDPDEVLLQACVRLVGRLSFCRVPHDCQISVQLMLGRADASTNFAYQGRPAGWDIRESEQVQVLRRGEPAECLAARWTPALATMSDFIPVAGVDLLCTDALKTFQRSRWPQFQDASDLARLTGSASGFRNSKSLAGVPA